MCTTESWAHGYTDVPTLTYVQMYVLAYIHKQDSPENKQLCSGNETRYVCTHVCAYISSFISHVCTYIRTYVHDKLQLLYPPPPTVKPS